MATPRCQVSNFTFEFQGALNKASRCKMKRTHTGQQSFYLAAVLSAFG